MSFVLRPFEGRLNCWEGNETRDNKSTAQKSPGQLLDRPCLTTGLYTYFVDNYLQSYPACNHPPTHTHTQWDNTFSLQAGTCCATVRWAKKEKSAEIWRCQHGESHKESFCRAPQLFVCRQRISLICFIALRRYCFVSMKILSMFLEAKSKC